jgi:hypothetical protein
MVAAREITSGSGCRRLAIHLTSEEGASTQHLEADVHTSCKLFFLFFLRITSEEDLRLLYKSIDRCYIRATPTTSLFLLAKLGV